MFRRFLVLFLVVPVLEVMLFLKVSEVLGLLNTIVVLLGLGMVGASLLRSQGLRLWMEIQASLARGVIPAGHLAEGAVIAGAGLLLVTPGFLTDAVGLLVLVPQSRRFLAQSLQRWFQKGLQAQTTGGQKRPTIIDI